MSGCKASKAWQAGRPRLDGKPGEPPGPRACRVKPYSVAAKGLELQPLAHRVTALTHASPRLPKIDVTIDLCGHSIARAAAVGGLGR